MDIQTIHMDPRVAHIHYRDYVKKVREGRIRRAAEVRARAKAAGEALGRVRIEKSQIEKEDEILLKSFRALARGERVIDLYKTLQRVGLQPDTKLPALAIAGATWKEVSLAHSGDNISFRQSRWSTDKKNSISVPANRFHAELIDWQWRERNNFLSLSSSVALVPDVPPYLRPDNLEDYRILWEPVWKRAAPVDPILLKHIDGPFYTVVAQWDLTLLEQSVLELRTPN